jgi:hypothetical protein
MALDNHFRLVFKELDPLLSEDMWHDFDDPLHETFLGFIWGYFKLYCNSLIDSCSYLLLVSMFILDL